MIRFSEASIEALIDPKGYDCACGRHHQMKMDYIKIGSGAIASIPEGLAAMGIDGMDMEYQLSQWDAAHRK